MAKFGKYAILDPIVHTFEKEPDWFWKIRPPTSGDELKIAKFLVNFRMETGPDGTRREFPPTNTEIAHREIALTFAGTNIPLSDESEEPALKEKASVEEIEALLRTMPHEMVLEIWDAVGDAVPSWGPVRRPLPPKVSE